MSSVSTFTRTTATEWVCTDCHLAIAGYALPLPEGDENYVTRAPFSGIDGIEDVTNGTPISECDTPECVAALAALLSDPTDPERFEPFDRAQGLHDECDHDSFSLHPCAGCGSTLAGDRYAVTVTYLEWDDEPPFVETCALEGQGHCSEDRFQVYNGRPAPVVMCGKHAPTH